MRVHFVADGPRDEAVLPTLVARVLGARVDPTFTGWPGLRVNGYARKLVFAHRQAIDAEADGMVAVVDQDREPSGSRMHALRKGRDEERARTPDVPIALGEARPHLEAWLLDDQVAIRSALGLPGSCPVPNVVRCKYPKAEVDTLRRAGSMAGEDVLTALSRIVAALEPSRCAHAKRTGLGAFVDEVRRELGPVAPCEPPAHLPICTS